MLNTNKCLILTYISIKYKFFTYCKFSNKIFANSVLKIFDSMSFKTNFSLLLRSYSSIKTSFLSLMESNNKYVNFFAP